MRNEGLEMRGVVMNGWILLSYIPMTYITIKFGVWLFIRIDKSLVKREL